MSCEHTEKIREAKYEAYQEYLDTLDEEFLLYEFNDRMGSDPEGYFTNAINAEKESAWKDALLDAYSAALYEDAEIDWINKEYKEACMPRKRFRASIYLDINAISQERAKEIGEKIAAFLSNPEEADLPKHYYNAYCGGAAEWIAGDLFGNVERMKKI